jgi:CubicO group peptidase (beta-lactamase class C family)
MTDRRFPPAAPTDARPASAVLFVRNGEVTFQRAYGVEDLDSHRPASPETAFYLCSVAKVITATAVALLADRGLLRYDDPVEAHLPEAPAFARAVTLRQLLLHTAGMPDYLRLAHATFGGSVGADSGRVPVGAEGTQRPLRVITNEDVLELLCGRGTPEFPPGTHWRYSNSGYVLLALVAARAAGQPFPTFLREQILAPAGMHHTVVYDVSRPPVPHLARAYRHGFDRYVPDAPTPRATRPAEYEPEGYEVLTVGDGGLFSTAEDLFRFDRALDGARLLSARAQEEVLRPGRLADGRPITPPRALGWRVGAVPVVWFPPRRAGLALPRVRVALRRRRFAFHPGGLGAYRAHFWRFPQARAALVVLSADGGLDVDAAVRPLLELLLAGRTPPPAG